MSELKGNLRAFQYDPFTFLYEELEVFKQGVMCPCSSHRGGQRGGEEKRAEIRNLQFNAVIY